MKKPDLSYRKEGERERDAETFQQKQPHQKQQKSILRQGSLRDGVAPSCCRNSCISSFFLGLVTKLDSGQFRSPCPTNFPGSSHSHRRFKCFRFQNKFGTSQPGNLDLPGFHCTKIAWQHSLAREERTTAVSMAMQLAFQSN